MIRPLKSESENRGELKQLTQSIESDLQIKFIPIGAIGVGKTRLLRCVIDSVKFEKLSRNNVSPQFRKPIPPWLSNVRALCDANAVLQLIEKTSDQTNGSSSTCASTYSEWKRQPKMAQM
jgi:hypothetical protein